jgi:transposase
VLSADISMRTIELACRSPTPQSTRRPTTIFCTPVTRNPRCPDCGRGGRYRDTISRPLTDLPVAGYPLVLQVAVPRYRCTTPACGRAMFNRDLGKLAAPRSSTTRRCAGYMLRRLMIDRTTVSAIAAEFGVSWHTVSAIAMRATADLIAAAGPVRLRDLVDGRSATALASWLAAQPASFAQAVEVIAMDGFAGYKTAATARPLIVGGARRSSSGKGPW